MMKCTCASLPDLLIHNFRLMSVNYSKKYGLKQASRVWYTELTNFLLNSGFKRSVSDASLFILHHHTTPINLIVYVDDIIVTGPNITNLNLFIKSLANRFFLKDLGTLSYFLGVEVTPTSRGLFLSQRKYISDLLDRMGMLTAKPSTTPMVITFFDSSFWYYT